MALLNLLSCIGNIARVITGNAKSHTGIVTGKHGGIENVLVDFEDKTLESLPLGIKYLFAALVWVYLLQSIPILKLINMSPTLLRNYPSGKTQGRIACPSNPHYSSLTIMGSGLGSQHCYRGDYDIQLFDKNM